MSDDGENETSSDKDGDIHVGKDFSIKFSNTPTTQPLSIGKSIKSNEEQELERSSILKTNSHGGTNRENNATDESTLKDNSKKESNARSNQIGNNDSENALFRKEVSGSLYDEAFPENIHPISSDEETRNDKITEQTSLLSPENEIEQSTIQISKTLDHQESVETNITEGSTTFSFRTLGHKQKLILISICLSNFLSYLCLSLIAPFFPDEAATKDVSDTVSGWIFGAYAFTQFILSPFFGRLIPYAGLRFMYVGGLFLAAGCTVLFGCLTFIDTSEENITFIIYCFLLRIMLAVGCCALATSGFTIIAKEFPDTVGTVFGTTEVFVGIGFMSGPPIGGFLYGAGGFVMPFAVIGAIMILGVPFNLWLIPSDTVIPRQERKRSVWLLLRSRKTVVNCMTVVVAAMIYSILDPTLEPHLNESFSLSSEIIGLLFLLMAAFYAIASPIIGHISDKLTDSRAVLIPGFAFAAAGMLFLGPSELIGLDDYSELWLNIVCLIVLGISSSAALIPTFDLFLEIAEEMGFDDDMEMYGMVAGLWGSMYSLGDFLGPSIGGFLLDNYGFPYCCTVTAGACIFMVPLLTLNWIWDTKCCSQKPFKTRIITIDIEAKAGERTPLLVDSIDKYDHDILSTYPPYEAVTST